MSKRRLPRRPRAPSVPCPAQTPDPATDPEAIALRVHHIADTAAVLAEAAALPDSHGEQLAGALYLIEASLLDVEQRVERLRRVPV